MSKKTKNKIWNFSRKRTRFF